MPGHEHILSWSWLIKIKDSFANIHKILINDGKQNSEPERIKNLLRRYKILFTTNARMKTEFPKKKTGGKKRLRKKTPV